MRFTHNFNGKKEMLNFLRSEGSQKKKKKMRIHQAPITNICEQNSVVDNWSSHAGKAFVKRKRCFILFLVISDYVMGFIASAIGPNKSK